MKGRATNRTIYLLIWAGGFLTLFLYAQSAHIGTGLFIILGGLLLIMLALVGVAFSLHEEMAKADPPPTQIEVAQSRPRSGIWASGVDLPGLRAESC